MFTGVSGSGKSSLVFGTIAAESQRLINETYSAFLQNFMPSMARPEVDVLEGLTTAIIVDQERMGANSRSTVGTVTDANAMLRVLFSRLGKPHIGPPPAFSFNIPTRRASGAMTTEKGERFEKKVVRDVVYQGGMCPRCEGMGQVNDIDLSQLYDETKSLSEGALKVPGYTAEGWHMRTFAAVGLDPDKPIRKYTKKELDILLYTGADEGQGRANQPHLRGSGPADQEVVPLQGRGRDAAAHPRVRRARGHVRDVSRVQRHAAERGRAVVEDRGKNIADVCAMQISDLARMARALRPRPHGLPSVAPLLAKLRHTLDSFVEIGLGYLSLDRPSGTLSGGEAQRTKMVGHLGSSLTDVTYVFDEPTIGLHPHDIQRMNTLLLRLRDKGNTVLVVEHKPEVIAIADHVVDLGPGAGTCRRGSRVRGHRRSAARRATHSPGDISPIARLRHGLGGARPEAVRS